MNTVKRLVVILMCLGFLANLFGCNKKKEIPPEVSKAPEGTASAEQKDLGEWKEFTISRSSMDNTYSFWFSVSVEDDRYILTGICRDTDGNEYNKEEEGVPLSEETIGILRGYGLESLPDCKPDKSDHMVLDADMESFSVVYKDGTIAEKDVSRETFDDIYSHLREYFIP